MKKNSFLVRLISPIGLLLLVASGSAAGEIPRIFYADPGQLATFVRIDAVLSSDGKVDGSLFSQTEVDTISAYMKLPKENGCVHLRGLIRDYINMGPLSSTNEASREAKLVLVGTVTAQAQGFSGSEAGTLLEIQPTEILKGSPRKASSSYQVFFPIATFSLRGRLYCASNPDWPPLPMIGDRLLLFVRNQNSPSTYLPLLDGTDVVVLKKTGAELPPSYKAERALKSLDSASIVERVRSYIEGGQH